MRSRRHYTLFISLIFSAMQLAMVHRAVASDTKAMDCEIGIDLAGKAFKRAFAAQKSDNDVVAYENRTAFWDIHRYSSHCEGVRKLAAEMTNKEMGKDAKPPSSEAVIRSYLASPDFAIPRSCWGKGSFGCNIIITEPPKGNTAGSQGDPSVYLLEGFGTGTGKPSTPIWKKFDQQKMVLPLTLESKSK